MTRRLRLTLAAALFALGASSADLPLEASSAPTMASTCTTFGPNWGQMGRYFTGICFNGFGAYYAKAHCYDDDGHWRRTVRGTIVWRQAGRFSEGYCPFGEHPWRRWVVVL